MRRRGENTVMPICKRCGKIVPWISRRGLCYACGAKAYAENIKQLVEKKGDYYEKWLKGITRGVKKELEKAKKNAEV